jgi:hypothetical protein
MDKRELKVENDWGLLHQKGNPNSIQSDGLTGDELF